VRILVAARQRRDVDPIAAHLAGEVGERFDRRDDAQLGLGAATQRGQRGDDDGDCDDDEPESRECRRA
jgi:hypothetical protein